MRILRIARWVLTGIVGTMAWRYFKTNEGPEILARIDAQNWRADVLGPDGWVSSIGLMRVVATSDNMDFDEIDEAEANRVAQRVHGAAAT